MKPPFPELRELSRSERLQLVQDLWDSIAEEPESVPVTEAQEAELDRRLEAHRDDPAAGAAWAEVKERLQGES